MKYRLVIDNEPLAVDIFPVEGKDAAEIFMEGRTHQVAYRTVSNGCLHLKVDGKAVETFLARTPKGKHVFIKGRTYWVEDQDTGPAARRNHRATDDIPGDVTPPMPSVVVRILVQEGEHVSRGQGLVVVSAMKMETTLAAPYDGFVERINTAVEAKVAPGDILVEIEQEASRHE